MADFIESPDTNAADASDNTTPDTAQMSDVQIASYFKTRAESSKRVIKAKTHEWKRNVELRIGHIATLYTGGVNVMDEIQTEINPDWSLTKTKTANLYSQVPTVRLSHENNQYKAALPMFARALNYEIGPKRANVAPAMEEMLNDVVNAAGVGAIFVGYQARFVDKLMPAIDPGMIPPDVMQQLEPTELPAGTQLDPETLQGMLMSRRFPMTRKKQVSSDRIFARRISPVDLLYPVEFVGSDFDEGDWIGYKGRCSWPEGQLAFDIPQEEYSKVTADDNSEVNQTLRSDPDRAALAETKKIKFDHIFYWRYRVDPNEKSFHAIWEIVFVEGMEKPAVHRPWTGQQLDEETGTYIGNCRFPVQVNTLTYITDNPIPPSDSQAGRPQVNDMRRSRRDMFANRERSVPIRWFDVNRIDQTIQTFLMRGTWQGMIPTNGDGSRAIGEIARASYPAENLSFDQAAKMDLMDSWQIGPGQNSSTAQSDETATAASITQQNFATRIGQERARVATTFLRVAELIAGYMVLYSDFPILTEQERAQMMQAWNNKAITQNLVFKILPDSQVVLDSAARIAKLERFLNITVKSGYVNPKPLIVEIAELSGIDPYEVVVDPQPKKPEPDVKFSFSGKDDLTNVMVLATLMAGGVPNEQQIDQAKKLLQLAAGAPQMPAQPAGPGAPPPAPGPSPVPEGGSDAHADWHLADKVAKRSRDTES